MQVRFYTQARLDILEKDKKGDKGEGPSRLPDAKKDSVSSHFRKCLAEVGYTKACKIVRYVVSNDGFPFRGQDWQRLKKIAEGNPDEEKIGA